LARFNKKYRAPAGAAAQSIGDMAAPLTKDQLAAFLGVPNSARTLKGHLAEQLAARIEADSDEHARFLETFKHELAFGPWDVEKVLGCTPSERKRWVADGKLPILGYSTFHVAARDIEYPIYDRRIITAITPETLAAWRSEHQSLVQVRRKTGAQKATESRKEHQHSRSAFRATWETMVTVWNSQGSPELAATFQLAYWTVWASRWAKENHQKMQDAIKYTERYHNLEQVWYQRKNNAFHLLMHTPFAHLSFYRPEEPDKMTLYLCDEHHEDRREIGMSKWEYYELFRKQVRQCSHCIVREERDYYSLYFLEIKADAFPGLRFSFHTPYPIGKALSFPKPSKLPKVDHSDHEQEEGLFRFGRALLSDEKIIYREPDVQAHFEAALAEFLTYFPQKQAETPVQPQPTPPQEPEDDED
jgi:hypothetical protein